MKITVFSVSEGVIIIFVEPRQEKEKLAEAQAEFLHYIKAIGVFVLVGKIINRREGLSYFRVVTPYPWPGFKEMIQDSLVILERSLSLQEGGK